MYPEAQRLDQTQRSSSRARRVLVVGVGALGCAATRTLASDRNVALTLLDDDRVEPSNLQRQVLFADSDVGNLKVEVAAQRLQSDFGARVHAEALRLDADNGASWIGASDLVVDATDDPATKFLIARLCADSATPYVYGGVARTGGQWMFVLPGESACLECAYPAPSGSGPQQDAAGCAALGILAPVAGFVGAMQGLKILQHIHRPERAAPGRLHLYEMTGSRSRHIDFSRATDCYCHHAERSRHTALSDVHPAASLGKDERPNERRGAATRRATS